jgi:hypothetical protein
MIIMQVVVKLQEFHGKMGHQEMLIVRVLVNCIFGLLIQEELMEYPFNE